MKRPKVFWIAWGLWVLCLVITLASAAGSLSAVEPWTWTLALVPLVSTALAALVVVRRPRHPIGWLLMIQGVGMTLAGLAGDYVNSGSVPPSNPSVLFLILLWMNSWSWLLLIFPLFYIALLFPTGRPLSPRWNGVLALGAGMCLFLITVATFAPAWSNEAQSWTVPNPIGLIPRAWVESELLWMLWSVALAALSGLSLASLFLRYRRGNPVEREQIKWVLSGCAVFAAVYIASDWSQAVPGDAPIDALLNLAFAPALLAIPASIAIAVLRHRLWDIDVIIRRTLLYSVLTALLALAYFGTILVLQALFGTVTGDAQSPLVTVVSTLAIALLFFPLRARVQTFIDRRFYRRKVDAARILAAFAATARDETDLDRLAARLVEVVQETMQPEPVALWLKRSENRGNRSEFSLRNALRNESRTPMD